MFDFKWDNLDNFIFSGEVLSGEYVTQDESNRTDQIEPGQNSQESSDNSNITNNGKTNAKSRLETNTIGVSSNRYSMNNTGKIYDWPIIPTMESACKGENTELISVENGKKVYQLAQEVIRVFAGYVDDAENYNFDRIIDATDFAFKAHIKQKRASGEPFIIHPLEVTQNLTELSVDEDTLVAALLHDTVEDTEVTLQDLTDRYGDNVSKLVDGVTKLEKITYNNSEDLQAENFRKMFLAMAQDIKVVLIKLADRLHNMRTMEHMPTRKQERISRETMDIYAPLAGRLGIYRWKWELEDLSFKYLESTAYYELVGAISQRATEREDYLNEVMEAMDEAIKENGIDSDIEGRPKHLYSIYRKMRTKEKNLNEIYELFACRVIVDTVTDCYAVLGIVHDMFRPMPGRFKDYIAMAKSNGYQSLHTTVIGPNGFPFEVQIRTFDMHQQAEYGVAAHWKYKANQAPSNKTRKTKRNEEKLQWLNQLLDWQKDMQSSTQYMEELREGLIEDEVYVFTPQGDVVALPEGATPIDFAYQIHTGVGNHMYGARVNDNMVPIDYELQNGDRVEILTSDRVSGPSRDWLKIAKSNSAKKKINDWFKKERKDESVERGRDMIDKEIRNSGFVSLQLLRPQFLEPILKRYSLHDVETLYAAVGSASKNGVSAQKIVPKLRDEYIKSLSDEERTELGYRIGERGQVIYSPIDPIIKQVGENADKGIETRVRSQQYKPNKFGIIVEGLDNALVNLANCCSPVPGDDIIGYVTRGKGVTVHRVDCNNMKSLVAFKNGDYEGELSRRQREEVGRLINVYWDQNITRGVYKVPIVITARDRSGLLLDVSNAVLDENVSIVSGQMNSVKDITASLHLTLEVTSQEQFDRVVGRIKAIRDVVEVRRDDL